MSFFQDAYECDDAEHDPTPVDEALEIIKSTGFAFFNVCRGIDEDRGKLQLNAL